MTGQTCRFWRRRDVEAVGLLLFGNCCDDYCLDNLRLTNKKLKKIEKKNSRTDNRTKINGFMNLWIFFIKKINFLRKEKKNLRKQGQTTDKNSGRGQTGTIVTQLELWSGSTGLVDSSRFSSLFSSVHSSSPDETGRSFRGKRE